MPCENYKDALTEAAASGADPANALRSNAKMAALRAHFESCASCRTAFAEEQALFISIDAGLHATANAEVPASLLPRVRAALGETAAPHRHSMSPLIFAAASIAFAFLVFLIARQHRPVSDDQAKQTPPISMPLKPPTGSHGEISPAGVQSASTSAKHLRAPRKSTLVHSAASSKPEVLVPPDEREAFARFVAALNARSDFAAAIVAEAPEKKDALVVVEPLQISDIELKPLESKEAESSNHAGEKH